MFCCHLFSLNPYYPILKKDKKALKSEIAIIKLTYQVSDDRIAEKEVTNYLDALNAGLYMLEHDFVKDDVAVQKQLEFKKTLEAGIDMLRKDRRNGEKESVAH